MKVAAVTAAHARVEEAGLVQSLAKNDNNYLTENKINYSRRQKTVKLRETE